MRSVLSRAACLCCAQTLKQLVGCLAARYMDSSDWLPDEHTAQQQQQQQQQHDGGDLIHFETKWTHNFVGNGRKIFVMFPRDDREKLLSKQGSRERGGNSGRHRAPKYIDPLNPPSDLEHSCFTAQCYFCDLRAADGYTLILPGANPIPPSLALLSVCAVLGVCPC